MRVYRALCLAALLVGCSGRAAPTEPVPVELPPAATLAPIPAPTGPAPRVVEPAADNVYAAETDEVLFVAWALPKDLAPIRAALASQPDLDGVIGRSTIKLCAAKAAQLGIQDKDCKLQLLLLSTNDEYTKSPAGAWTAVGQPRLPPAQTTAAAAEASLALDTAAVKALFTRFELRYGELR